jgi:hypothetical protein
MRCADYCGHMSGIIDNKVTAMATPVDVEAVIPAPGANHRRAVASRWPAHHW